ncbi:MAG: hypothetical protein QOD62_2955 [Actinomycetota bacterium]|nr:hypothetical protein [Actinomycetota bacterium]
MGLLGRKRSNGGESEAPATAPQPTGIPDYGFNQPKSAAPKAVTDLLKQTSYPQGAEGFARFSGRERTTSYQSQSGWSRHTYDTIN